MISPAGLASPLMVVGCVGLAVGQRQQRSGCVTTAACCSHHRSCEPALVFRVLVFKNYSRRMKGVLMGFVDLNSFVVICFF